MENSKTILLYNITPEELKNLIVKDLKIELDAILSKTNEPQFYSVQDASKLLNVSELTIYNHIKKGVLKAFKMGRKYQIKKVDLEEALKDVKSLKYKR